MQVKAYTVKTQFSVFDSTCPTVFQLISVQQLPTSFSKETQTGYILNKSEESKIETMRVGAIINIYIIYVACNMKENQKQAKRLKYIREFGAANDMNNVLLIFALW